MNQTTACESIRKLCLALLIALGLTGCSVLAPSAAPASPQARLEATLQPTYTHYPTYTPRPTYTPHPTYTPLPTYTLLPLSGPAFDVGMTPAPGEISQYASAASASSEFSQPGWSSMQAAGVPNTYGCGDAETAWASLEPQGIDWLVLTYDQAVIPTRIVIYQNFNPGAIIKVEVIDESGQAVTVYTGKAALSKFCPFTLEIPVNQVNKPVRSIRLTLDQSQHNGRNEIDAVQLLGKP
jgi:hypothetical protein